MKERPILFSAPMVRAILDGRKTITRRIVKSPALPAGAHSPAQRSSLWTWMMGEGPSAYAVGDRACPYGAPGDRLWVRETWGPWRCTSHESDEHEPVLAPLDGSWARELAENGRPSIEYRATSESVGPWKPAIHMPRWASRILLDVTDVRVERLQTITEEDARAEGVGALGRVTDHRGAFVALWESINGERAPWSSNCWVWRIAFKRADESNAAPSGA